MDDIVTLSKLRKQYIYAIKTPYSELKNAKQEIEDFEKRVIKDSSVCSSSVIKYINANKYNLSYGKLKKKIVDDFNNPDAMAAYNCIVKTFITTDEITLQEKVRNWINSVTIINEDDGVVVLSDNNKTFIIKTDYNSNESLLHEYFIGINGLNKLREYVPNFMYTFGYWKCSSLIKDKTSFMQKKDINTWCTKDGLSQYLVLENINPSISMRDFVKDLDDTDFSVEVWLNIFMQLLYSINKAHELIDFTHYDLHSRNVLIRKINLDKFTIRYETERGIEYLNTSFVATIIDYGYSHMKYEGKDVGFIPERRSKNVIKANVYHNISNPLSDMHKILVDSYINSKSKIGNLIDKIYRFFNKSGIKSIAGYQEFFYSIPPVNNKSLFDLAKYIRSLSGVNINISTKPNMQVINSNARKSVNKYLENFLSPNQHQDLYLFYESHKSSSDDSRKSMKFNYKESFSKAKDKLELLLQEVDELDPDVFVLEDPDDISEINMEYVDIVVTFYDLMFQVDSLLKAMKYVSNLYNYDKDYIGKRELDINYLHELLNKHKNDLMVVYDLSSKKYGLIDEDLFEYIEDVVENVIQ